MQYRSKEIPSSNLFKRITLGFPFTIMTALALLTMKIIAGNRHLKFYTRTRNGLRSLGETFIQSTSRERLTKESMTCFLKVTIGMVELASR
ncbi:Uncharacterized protein XB16_0896 [Leptospira santarosai]|uniref:Uncharacterized protein n=1 Tax=Leptospira santarosai TaxID=28183 RepID=A0A2P1QQQ9_9LEPT|nr:Uncharacterized protein XB16_0896 [Leptospira santarosai]